jgi:hypothetical protein
MLDWVDRGFTLCPSMSMSVSDSKENRVLATRVIQALFDDGHKEILSGRHHTLYDIRPAKMEEFKKVKDLDIGDVEKIQELAGPIVTELYKLGGRQVELCIYACVYVRVCIFVCVVCVYMYVCIWVFFFCI